MKKAADRNPCEHCSSRAGAKFAEDITMAFQPIFDIAGGKVFAQEALVRGKDGRSASEIFQHVTPENQYQFDQLCRTTAIRTASRLGIDGAISINFMPNAVYDPENCIKQTLNAADKCGFDIRRIIFEFTESENVVDTQHLQSIMRVYRKSGFRTAIDDFGAGYAGLNLLADIVPDILKIDRHLITDIDKNKVRQILVRQIVAMCEDLGVEVVAEGIETPEELSALGDLGVNLIQGYYLATPQFESLQTHPNSPLQPAMSKTG